MKKEARKHMADRLSVLKYYLYYKYKSGFQTEAPWNGGR